MIHYEIQIMAKSPEDRGTMLIDRCVISAHNPAQAAKRYAELFMNDEHDNAQTDKEMLTRFHPEQPGRDYDLRRATAEANELGPLHWPLERWAEHDQQTADEEAGTGMNMTDKEAAEAREAEELADVKLQEQIDLQEREYIEGQDHPIVLRRRELDTTWPSTYDPYSVVRCTICTVVKRSHDPYWHSWTPDPEEIERIDAENVQARIHAKMSDLEIVNEVIRIAGYERTEHIAAMLFDRTIAAGN